MYNYIVICIYHNYTTIIYAMDNIVQAYSDIVAFRTLAGIHAIYYFYCQKHGHN